MRKMHSWKPEEDILAFFLYRFDEREPVTLKSVAKNMGFGTYTGSLRMRIGNFRAIDVGGGLPNASKQTVKIYEEYKNYDEEKLYVRCKEIMECFIAP